MARAAHHFPFRWHDLYSCGPRKQFCSAPKAAAILFLAMSTCVFPLSIRWKNLPKLRERIRLPQFQIKVWDVSHCLRGILELEVQLVGSGRFSFRRRTRANHAEVAENPQLVNAKFCGTRAAPPDDDDVLRCESCCRPTTVPRPAYTPQFPVQIFGTRPCGPLNLRNKLSMPSSTGTPFPIQSPQRAKYLWVNCENARWELIQPEIMPRLRLHFATTQICRSTLRGLQLEAMSSKACRATRLQLRPCELHGAVRGPCA